MLFLAQKFVLSMIVRIFAASVLAKPLNNAQIVRGVFCLYTFEHGESYGSPDKPRGLSIQPCKSEKEEPYIRHSSQGRSECLYLRIE